MNALRTRQLALIGVAFLSLAMAVPGLSQPDASARKKANAMSATKPAIVLVHGAFADASSWNRVIPLLEKNGYTVTAVQNGLTSVSDDVSTTRRLIEAQKGSVVVVGHSYGGAVITEAAAGNPNVKALVYIAAFAPDAGETVGALNEKFKPSALGPALTPDAAGFLFIDRTKFHDVFCADMPAPEAKIMAATQKPIAAACFAAPIQSPAWKAIPTWYLVSQHDQAINPELERFMAKRMKAHTAEVAASHVPFLSHPGVVASMIESAARSVETQAAQ